MQSSGFRVSDVGSRVRVYEFGLNVEGFGLKLRACRRAMLSLPYTRKPETATQGCSGLRVQGERFRGGLVFTAHRLVYHSTLGFRVIKEKKKKNVPGEGGWRCCSSRALLRRVQGFGPSIYGSVPAQTATGYIHPRYTG